MTGVEKKENYIENIKLKEKNRLKKWWVLESYGWDIKLINYWNIFWVKWVKWKENIIYFIDKKWKFLFQIPWLRKSLWNKRYNGYLKKLWYIEKKDQNWYYHMINIKTWKELPQKSIEYYKKFEILSQAKDRLDVIWTIFDGDKTNKETPKWSIKEFWLTLLKEANKILVKRWIKSWVIKPFEIHYLYHQKQLSDQEKYLKQTLTFKYLSNLINNQAIDLVWEQGSIPVKLDWKKYKINFWPITKEELDYYKAKKWINEKMYKELIKILEEQKKLEKQKKKEEQKHTKEVKKEISGLEDEVKK